MTNLTLHDHELDEPSYKVRLLMSVLGLPHTRVVVNMFPGEEHKSPAYLKLNPRGTLPVLVDEGFVLADAEAILGYLAKAYDPANAWLPAEPRGLAKCCPGSVSPAMTSPPPRWRVCISCLASPPMARPLSRRRAARSG